MTSSETLRVPAFRRKKQLIRKAAKKTTTRRGAKKLKMKKKKMKVMKTIKKTIPKKMPILARTKRPLQPGLRPVGMVTHFYDRISVGVLKLSNTLKVGDRIRLKGKSGEFDQMVSSIQREHQPVPVAKKGADIGIKVDQPVKVDQIAYLVK